MLQYNIILHNIIQYNSFKPTKKKDLDESILERKVTENTMTCAESMSIEDPSVVYLSAAKMKSLGLQNGDIVVLKVYILLFVLREYMSFLSTCCYCC